jgi:hypothetical protein
MLIMNKAGSGTSAVLQQTRASAAAQQLATWLVSTAMASRIHCVIRLLLLPLPLLLLLLPLPQTFQLDADHKQGGEWYLGSVAADARITKPHSEVAADPFGCGGLWERYKVQWDDEEAADDAAEGAAEDVPDGGEGTQNLQQQQGLAEVQQNNADAAAGAAVAAAAAGGGDGGDDSWLSPWELYAAGQTSEAVLAAEHTTQLTGEQVCVIFHKLFCCVVRNRKQQAGEYACTT